jgi:hypothetical protein
MQAQDWQGRHLDKDIIVHGNKIYSKETCAFVSPELNTFVLQRDASRGEFPIGVCFDSRRNVFRAQCRNPFTYKNENLGAYKTPEDAHEAWRRRKHQLACELADYQQDVRVANALRIRYA